MVWHLVLVSHKPVQPRVPQRSNAYRIGFPIGRLSSLLLAVATVNRHTGVIKNEIMPFLFRHNEFKLTLKHHKGWLNSIPRKHAACMRRLIIACDGKNKHAVVNLTAMQNTMRKRLGGDQLRELTYQLMWSMNDLTAVRHFDAPEFRHCWKKWTRLEKITVDTGDRGRGAPHERLGVEEYQRVFSRLGLDSRVKVHGRNLHLWRRDQRSLAWGTIEVTDGWKDHCIKNKKEGRWDPKSRESWEDINNITLSPSATMTDDEDE